MQLSKNALKLKQSATFTVNTKRMKMIQQGIDVVNFGVGEPDFDTPEFIKEAAVKALKDGQTKYTAIAGMTSLRKAIADKLKRDNNLDYEPAQIVVTNGARQAIGNAIAALVNPQDEVLIISPAWISYQQLITLNGGVPVLVPVDREHDYLPTREALESMVSSRSKLLIITTPSNPTGRIMGREVLEMIAEFAISHNLYVISDEIYEKIAFDHIKHISIASLGKEIFERTIVINGLSKSHSMTGWRMGYSASNSQLAKMMTNIQNHYTAGINTMTQVASLAALEGSEDCVREMVAQFQVRRDYIYQRINGIKGLYAVKPQGAFYLFIDITELIGKKYKDRVITSALDFAEILLEEKAVALVACEDFGIENHVRASYATAMENLIKGADRIEEFVKKLV